MGAESGVRDGLNDADINPTDDNRRELEVIHTLADVIEERVSALHDDLGRLCSKAGAIYERVPS